MSVWARLGAFLLVLFGTFGTAYAVGERMPGHSHAGGHTHTHGPASVVPAGFEMGDYQLVTDSIAGAHGQPRVLTFHLQHKDGTRVTEYQKVHGARLHVIVIRPDLSDFSHVHPDVQKDGSWKVPLDEPGAWHLVFDSTPENQNTPIVVSANADDEVAVNKVPLPAADDDVVVDGLHIVRSGLSFAVTNEDGTPAQGLEPYLEQPAHLVAIRQGDLAYAHLHPMLNMTGMFMFGDKLPQPGTYRMFLQFGHRGKVVTVPFTVVQA
jgi:hypothetical protein